MRRFVSWIVIAFLLISGLTNCKPRRQPSDSTTKEANFLPCPEPESDASPGYCKWNHDLTAFEGDINNIVSFEFPWNPNEINAFGGYIFSSPSLVYINSDFEKMYQVVCMERYQEYAEVGRDENDQPVYDQICPSNTYRNDYQTLLNLLRSQTGFQMYLGVRMVSGSNTNFNVYESDESLKKVLRLKPQSFYVKKVDDNNFKFGISNYLETFDQNDLGNVDANDLCKLVLEGETRPEFLCTLILTNANFGFYQQGDVVSASGQESTAYTVSIDQQYGEAAAIRMQSAGRYANQTFMPILETQRSLKYTLPTEDSLPNAPSLLSSYQNISDWKPEDICPFFNGNGEYIDFPETLLDYFRSQNRHVIDVIEAKDRFVYNSFYILDWVKDTSSIPEMEKTFDYLRVYDRNHEFLLFVRDQSATGNISLTKESFVEIFHYADIPSVRGPQNLREMAEALCIDHNIWDNSTVWIHEGTSNVWYADPAEWASTLLTGPLHSGLKAIGRLAGNKVIGGKTIRSSWQALRRFVPTKQVEPQLYVRPYPSVSRLTNAIPGVNFLANRVLRNYPVPLPNANRPLKNLLQANRLPQEAYEALTTNVTQEVVDKFNRTVGSNYLRDDLLEILNEQLMRLARKIEYVDFEMFEIKVWEATAAALKVITDEGKIPVFVASANKEKSNYWVWRIAESFLNAVDSKLETKVLWITARAETDINSLRAVVPNLDHIDNYAFIFMDDGVYSGSQLSSTMSYFAMNLNDIAVSDSKILSRLNLMNISPFQTDYSIPIFFQKFHTIANRGNIQNIQKLRYYTHMEPDLSGIALSPVVEKHVSQELAQVIHKIRPVTDYASEIQTLIDFNDFYRHGTEDLATKAVFVFQHKIADGVSLYYGMLNKVFPNYFVANGTAVRPPYK